jgi:hypothetical protein
LLGGAVIAFYILVGAETQEVERESQPPQDQSAAGSLAT